MDKGAPGAFTRTRWKSDMCMPEQLRINQAVKLTG